MPNCTFGFIRFSPNFNSHSTGTFVVLSTVVVVPASKSLKEVRKLYIALTSIVASYGEPFHLILPPGFSTNFLLIKLLNVNK